MSKIQTWKRITTIHNFFFKNWRLYLICQRYKLESESQLTLSDTIARKAVFNMSKIQTWKRITTNLAFFNYITKLYLICQRYKLESESQQRILFSIVSKAVFNMSKIQTWKRITTCRLQTKHRLSLYLICQRYKLESESQPPSRFLLRC